jgi:hypothetical protein
MAEPTRSLVIERILRDREGLWKQILHETRLKSLIGQLMASSSIALACYGAVLGASASIPQAIASAVKLPILFLVTLVICLPTLYLFNLVFGARLSIRQAIALVLVAVTVISALSLAFAPVSLFFLVTAPNYAFYKILNVSILMLTGIVGLGVLLDGMTSLNKLAGSKPAAAVEPVAAVDAAPATPVLVSTVAEKPAEVAVQAENGHAARPAQQAPLPHFVPQFPGQQFPGQQYPGQPYGAFGAGVRRPEEPRVNVGLIRIWVLLFGFVGTQLAWTLRPFVGSPDENFQIFRSIEGNFYVNIVETIGKLFGA